MGVMELKVWVEGVVRVVCGLSLSTACQDVVIALAQAIGQTGRYVLILKLRGVERQLVADDCPLQHLAKLGQLAAEVQFILRRTGPSLSGGQDTPASKRRLPLSRPSNPEPLKSREQQQALTFSLAPSTPPTIAKADRAWSPATRASPELRASPVSFLDSRRAFPSSASKEEVFRQILQQQRRLQDLEIQLQTLERETELWELGRSSASAPGPTPAGVPAGKLEELEQQMRQNKAELMHEEHWEEQLQAELSREREMHRRLHQIHSSVDDHGSQIKELHACSAHLEQDLKLRAQRQSSRAITGQTEEALRPLKQELHFRLQQAEELDAALSQIQREQQAAEQRLQDRLELDKELNKELRQCKLQQFIQQTGGPHADQTDVYLSCAGIKELQQPGHCTTSDRFIITSCRRSQSAAMNFSGASCSHV